MREGPGGGGATLGFCFSSIVLTVFSGQARVREGAGTDMIPTPSTPSPNILPIRGACTAAGNPLYNPAFIERLRSIRLNPSGHSVQPRRDLLLLAQEVTPDGMVAVLLRLGPVHLDHVVGPRPRALGHANLRVCEAVPQAERTQRDTTPDRRKQRVALREQAPPPAGGGVSSSARAQKGRRPRGKPYPLQGSSGYAERLGGGGAQRRETGGEEGREGAGSIAYLMRYYVEL